jgi:hypothetical protein
VDCSEVVTRTDDDDRTREVAACQRQACTRVDRCSKNVPNRATLRHFSGRPAGLAGGKPRSACAYSIARLDRTCRPSGHRQTAWPRRPRNGHFSGRLLFTISKSQETAMQRELTAADRSPRGRLACLGLASLTQPAVGIRRFGTMPKRPGGVFPLRFIPQKPPDGLVPAGGATACIMQSHIDTMSQNVTEFRFFFLGCGRAEKMTR